MLTFFYWLLTLAQASLIFYLSSLQSVGLPMFWQSDKVFHAIAYFALAFFLSLALSRYKLSAKTIFIIVLIVCPLYGMSDEFHQSFVPTRSVELLDFMADTTGSFFGAMIFTKFFFKRKCANGEQTA